MIRPALFLLLFLSSLTSQALAAEYIVGSNSNRSFTAIQDAIDRAADGDTVSLADGVYAEESHAGIRFNGKKLTVRSRSGDPASCIIECSAHRDSLVSRGFLFESEESRDSILAGVTIRFGRARGGDNPDDRGGAIRIANASPTIVNCVFVGNIAGTGGAISCYRSSASIIDCRFESNTAGRGGAVFIYRSAPSIENCVFHSNTSNLGGAIMAKLASVHLAGSRAVANLGERGGAVYLSQCPQSGFENCLVSGNCGVFGGGIYLSESSARVTACAIVANTAGSGGGIHCQDGSTIEISNTAIVGSRQGEAIACGLTSRATAHCSLVAGNGNGDWASGLEGQSGLNGNLAEMPDSAESNAASVSGSSPGWLPIRSECGIIGFSSRQIQQTDSQRTESKTR